jgi:putative spermidine/putrescine transport system substrate-binding protein
MMNAYQTGGNNMATQTYSNFVTASLATAWLAVGMVPMNATAQEQVKNFKGEELVVQTLTGTAGKFFRDTAGAFEKKYNAKLVMFESLSSDTVAKMRANAGRQESDVWMVAESWASVLQGEKLLEPLTPAGVPNMQKLVPSGRGKGDAYVNMSTSAMNLTYNKNKLSQADLPRTWEDLANPKYKGCLLLPAANSSFSTTLIAKLNYIQGGNNDNIDKGIESLKKISPNVMTYWTSFDQLFNLINSGQACLAVGSSDRTIDQAQKGAPVGATYPEQGTIFLANAIGVSAGTPHKELAETYINYLLSEDVQKLTADRIGQIPYLQGIEMPENLKELLPSDTAMKNSPTPDWSVVMQKQPQWTDRYVKEVVSK